MSFNFSSIGHMFATVAHDVVKVSKVVEQAIGKIQATETQVESLTALVNQQAVVIERTAYGLLGLVVAAVDAADAAASANGVDLKLDEATVTAIKAIIPALKTASATVTTGVKS